MTRTAVPAVAIDRNISSCPEFPVLSPPPPQAAKRLAVTPTVSHLASAIRPAVFLPCVNFILYASLSCCCNTLPYNSLKHHKRAKRKPCRHGSPIGDYDQHGGAKQQGALNLGNALVEVADHSERKEQG